MPIITTHVYLIILSPTQKSKGKYPKCGGVATTGPCLDCSCGRGEGAKTTRNRRGEGAKTARNRKGEDAKAENAARIGKPDENSDPT